MWTSFTPPQSRKKAYCFLSPKCGSQFRRKNDLVYENHVNLYLWDPFNFQELKKKKKLRHHFIPVRWGGKGKEGEWLFLKHLLTLLTHFIPGAAWPRRCGYSPDVSSNLPRVTRLISRSQDFKAGPSVPQPPYRGGDSMGFELRSPHYRPLPLQLLLWLHGLKFVFAPSLKEGTCK